MDYEKLWDDLIAAAKTDMDYQQALKEVENLEASYQELVDSLPPKQKSIIEDYIAACEAMEDYMTLIAYRLGKGNA